MDSTVTYAAVGEDRSGKGVEDFGLYDLFEENDEVAVTDRKFDGKEEEPLPELMEEEAPALGAPVLPQVNNNQEDQDAWYDLDFFDAGYDLESYGAGYDEDEDDDYQDDENPLYDHQDEQESRSDQDRVLSPGHSQVLPSKKVRHRHDRGWSGVFLLWVLWGLQLGVLSSYVGIEVGIKTKQYEVNSHRRILFLCSFLLAPDFILIRDHA